MRDQLTAERARELLAYDPDTGVLRWKVRRGAAHVGSLAGTPSGDGRLVCGVDGENYLVHRVVWLIAYGRWPDAAIDHVNTDPLDNRLANLREATGAENNQNIGRTRAASGVRGVTMHAGKWQAQIKLRGKNYYLGRFESVDEARDAYLAKRRELFTFQPEMPQRTRSEAAQ